MICTTVKTDLRTARYAAERREPCLQTALAIRFQEAMALLVWERKIDFVVDQWIAVKATAPAR